MEKNSQDELIRAYTTLKSLRNNIENMEKSNIEQSYVDDFHTALKRITDIGIDVIEYCIPVSEINPIEEARIVTVRPGELIPKGSYTKEKYVKKPYILTKIDSIIGYLEILISERPKSMGFNTQRD